MEMLAESYQMAPWKVRFSNWWVNDGRRDTAIAFWILAQMIFFAWSYWRHATGLEYVTFRSFLYQGLPVARASANLIKFNCAVILLPMCKNAITALRSTPLKKIVAFDAAVQMHQLIAWSMVFWVVVHIVGHGFNYYNLEVHTKSKMTILSLLFTSGPGATGLILCLLMAVMFYFARASIRRKSFELFWYTHHLFIPFFAVTMAHGAFCFIKSDTPDKCATGFQFWKYFIFSCIVYAGERLIRMYRARQPCRIVKVIQHPSDVCEIQFKKPTMNLLPGQFVYLNVPEISSFQWHPFTFSSCPDEDHFSVHIRKAGDWTSQLGTLLGCNFRKDPAVRFMSVLPQLRVDGPYGAASQEVYDHPVAVLVAGGIGVTPFASILKDIWYRFKYPERHPKMKLQKVYFYWITREKEAFEWFQDLLSKIEEDGMDQFIEISTHLTQRLKHEEITEIICGMDDDKDTITQLRARTNYGRPNWNNIFGKIRQTHPKMDIGILTCGPKALSDDLYQTCNRYTGENGVRFYFRKEVF